MSDHIFQYEHSITKADRSLLNKQRPLIVWFTGLSGSGKSTLANRLEQELFEQGFHTYVLDGDNIRSGINKDLSFSEKDRTENIRRIGEIAKLFVDAGIIVLVAFISPFESDRKFVRSLVDPGEFIEVYLNCPIDECEKRDVKGLYKKAKAGEIKDFTGIHSPYEAPLSPEIEIKTGFQSTEESLKTLMDYILSKIVTGK